MLRIPDSFFKLENSTGALTTTNAVANLGSMSVVRQVPKNRKVTLKAHLPNLNVTRDIVKNIVRW